MADILVDGDGISDWDQRNRRHLVWVNNLRGYWFYQIDNEQVAYRRSIDGGLTWDARILLESTVNTVVTMDIWYDRWTPGDNGDLIHVVWTTYSSDGVYYRALNAATNTFVEAAYQAFAGSTFIGTARPTTCISITKASGSNLMVQYWGDEAGEHGLLQAVSPYGSTDWTSRLSGADGNAADFILMFPDPTAPDPNDVCMMYWDRSANEVTVKKYDHSLNTWSEPITISTSLIENTTEKNWGATMRFSDNHLLATIREPDGGVSGVLYFYDINLSAETYTEVVVIASVVHNGVPCIVINQINDYLYIMYVGSENNDETWSSAVHIYYKRSIDGGTTWEAEVRLSDTLRTYRAVHGGLMVLDTGGRISPVVFHQGPGDFYINVANSLEISAPSDFIDVPKIVLNTDVVRAADSMVLS